MNAFHKGVAISVFALILLTVTSVSAFEAVELSNDNSKVVEYRAKGGGHGLAVSFSPPNADCAYPESENLWISLGKQDRNHGIRDRDLDGGS